MTGPFLSFIVPMRAWDEENVARIRAMLPPRSELVVATVPGGAAHARNVGAASARGSVLVFMDEDVRLSGDWDRTLEKLEGDWDFAIAQWYTPAPGIRSAWMVLACGGLNILTRIFRYRLTMSGFTVMRRAVFDTLGGYPLDTTYEEPALTMRLYHAGFRGIDLPIRVTMLRRWDSFHRFNDTTSRNKPHPDPKPHEVMVRYDG